MKKWFLYSILFCLFSLTSCIEIIDDLTLNVNGSGTFKYTINLSSSKVKINSILALDSLNGNPIPSKDDIKTKIQEFKSRLALQEGIQNVTMEEDYTNYLFKLSCDFDNVNELQDGIKKAISEVVKHQKGELDNYQWITLNNNSLSRSIPYTLMDQAKKLKGEELEMLKQGSYTSITRFENEVERFENEASVLSKSKKAVMLRANTHSLVKNVDLIKNRIYLIN